MRTMPAHPRCARREVLLAGVSDGLLGDDPAALNLRQCNLDGASGLFNLGIECSARQKGSKGGGCGECSHDADEEPTDP